MTHRTGKLPLEALYTYPKTGAHTVIHSVLIEQNYASVALKPHDYGDLGPRADYLKA